MMLAKYLVVRRDGTVPRWPWFVLGGRDQAARDAMRFYLQREPVNMLAQSLRCAPIALVSLMGGVLGAVASIPGMPPQLSPFVPSLILLPLAIAAGTSVKT